MSEIKSSSPYKSVQGAGSGLRPSSIDLGKFKGGSEEVIKSLMAPLKKAKHHLRPKPHDQSVNV